MYHLIEKKAAKILNCEYIPKGQYILMNQRIDALRKCANNEITAVAGELSKEAYGKFFADIISKKMSGNAHFKVRLLFLKDDESKEKAIEKMWVENKDICTLFKEGRFENQFSIYWAERRPKFHYHIIDNNLVLEEVHEHGVPRATLILKDNTYYVQKYKERFNITIQNPIIHKLNIKDF